MILFMNIKQIGKRKNVVDKVPFTYEKVPKTVREFIEETVRICVDAYKERMEQGEVLLSQEQIEERSQIGKIAFGIIYGEQMPEVKEAIATAITAFEDGLYRVFLEQNGEEMQELEGLEEPLELSEGDTLTFIRLTMLAGRMW